MGGSDEIVIYCSNLTDTRHLERALAAAGRRYRIERMGMGDAAMRERFEELCEQAGVRRLPLIRIGRRWLGEAELLDELARAPLPRGALLSLWLLALPLPAGALALWLGVDVDALLRTAALMLLALLSGVAFGAGLRDVASAMLAPRAAAVVAVGLALTLFAPAMQYYALALMHGALPALDRRLVAMRALPSDWLAPRLAVATVCALSLVAAALAVDWPGG